MTDAAGRGAPRILLVRLSALGDVVTTLPAFDLLRRSLPDADFAWAVESPFRPLLEGLGIPTIALRTKAWRKAPLAGSTRAEILESFRQLRSFRPDVAVDFQGTLKSAVLARASGAGTRLGLGRGDLREPLASALYTLRGGQAPAGRHVVDRGISLARSLLEHLAVTPAPFDPAATTPFAHVPQDPEGRIREFLARSDRSLALLQPAAGWPNKEWGSERFAELAVRLASRGHRVAILHGPGERALGEEVVRLSSGAAELAPATSIRELAALLAGAQLVVGGDTGPVHLSAGLGTETLGILGPTVAEVHGPRGGRARSIGAPLPCRPCARRYDERKPCLAELGVNDVAAAATPAG